MTAYVYAGPNSQNSLVKMQCERNKLTMFMKILTGVVIPDVLFHCCDTLNVCVSAESKALHLAMNVEYTAAAAGLTY
jgi:hypothetical protein